MAAGQTRLPRYAVQKLDGEFDKTVYSYEAEDGKKVKTLTPMTVRRPMGYMVFCPRGHSFHVETEKELKRLGLRMTNVPVHDLGINEDVPEETSSDVHTLVANAARVNKPRMKRMRDEVSAED